MKILADIKATVADYEIVLSEESSGGEYKVGKIDMKLIVLKHKAQSQWMKKNSGMDVWRTKMIKPRES